MRLLCGYTSSKVFWINCRKKNRASRRWIIEIGFAMRQRTHSCTIQKRKKIKIVGYKFSRLFEIILIYFLRKRHVEMVRIFSTWQCFMWVVQIFSMRFLIALAILLWACSTKPNQTKRNRCCVVVVILCRFTYTNSRIKRQ